MTAGRKEGTTKPTGCFVALAIFTLSLPMSSGLAADGAGTPPPLTGNGAKVVWSQDFSVVPLTLRDASNPTSGAWMANDATWQSPVQGYVDFAARPCSAAALANHRCNIAGGVFDLNPNDPTMQGVTPFSQGDGYLTISAFRTPESLAPAIAAEMKAQGQSGPIPSFVGGRLMANPAVFPGFTYGYFEFRVAFPNAGPGMFPALWFYAAPGRNPAKPHAEIDLLEFFGHSDTFTTTMYSGGADDNVGARIGEHPGLVDAKFHTYGMDWTAQHIDFYVDYRKVYSAPDALAIAYRGVVLLPILNYAVDADWMTSNTYLQANETTPNPLTMRVNYVRLYDVRPF